jgi:alpha-glucosidase
VLRWTRRAVWLYLPGADQTPPERSTRRIAKLELSPSPAAVPQAFACGHPPALDNSYRVKRSCRRPKERFRVCERERIHRAANVATWRTHKPPSVSLLPLTLAVLCLIVLPAVAMPSAQRPARPVTVRSPDGQIRVTFRLRAAPGGQTVPSYRVTYRGTLLVGDSDLGLDFAETGPFGNGLRIVGVTHAAHDERVRGILGKTTEARDHYREAVVALAERAPPHRRIELVLRAYADGVALRYRIPAQPALAAFTITEERTQVALDGSSRAYALTLPAFTSSYEGYYTAAPLHEIAPDTLIALPLLLRHPGGAWVAVTEAALTDYAGMYLSRARHAPGVLVSRLSPWPGQPEVKVRATAPHASPWRVLMVGDDPGRLIESNLVYLLNAPSALADTSWIRPGKTAFPWWNDYVVPDTSFAGGLNTRTMKYYIDFCAANGIEYHTLDGFRDVAWYGGPIIPNGQAQDITTALAEIDLPEVLRYAREKGVRLRLWMHWEPLRAQLDEALAQYQAWGIEGIMLDFMDRDDQQMVRFYHEVAEKAAARHLTVTFHGAYKPTGSQRTYPNMLTWEGVLNLEYNKFNGSPGSTPEHELVVPFTRMLAGPLDYHQGGFRYVAEGAFRNQTTAPLVVGTRARTLAMYIVYENSLPMVADYPAAYQGQRGLDFVARIPTTWDETRVLNAAVGDVITVARRRGRTWYVGSMTDGSARRVDVPLRFLGAGAFVAEIYADDPDAPPRALRQQFLVRAADVLRVRMAPAGGHAIRLTPAPPGTRLPGYPREP